MVTELDGFSKLDGCLYNQRFNRWGWESTFYGGGLRVWTLPRLAMAERLECRIESQARACMRRSCLMLRTKAAKPHPCRKEGSPR